MKLVFLEIDSRAISALPASQFRYHTLWKKSVEETGKAPRVYW